MECLDFDGIALEETSLIHDSAGKGFRRPLGAVTLGTEVWLALKAESSDIEQVTLCGLKGDAPSFRVPMYRSGGDGLWTASLSTENEGDGVGGFIVWYWFEIGLRGGALCYYGAVLPYPSGLGHIYRNPPPAFQITVYDRGFSTPDWAKSAVMYQIFPDRFCMGDEGSVRAGIDYHVGMGRAEFELHENWDDMPVYEAKDGQRYYMPSDMYGGDLEGVRQKLPYLKGLGITLLYLNPIFEAASNHRYNTGDYLKIDPVLGDADSFRRLAAEARDMGVRVILDGVFSHTGDDSLYFNKYGRYPGAGAYQSKDSPYFGWYEFEEYPDKYKSWWGFETLPEVNEFDPGWQEFIVTGKDSVVKHWLGEGASGYRLDVADELPDYTIGKIRHAIKETDPDAFLLGEVWEDATTKHSYGKQRAYALGLGLDSVMNYPFAAKTIEFLTNKIDARLYCRFLAHQRQSYPPPMYFALMNLLSSHDISRIRTRLSSDVDPGSMSRGEQARFTLTEDEFRLGGLRQRLAAAIQFSLPGIPSVYYGDECGMTGLLDPFNRRALCEEDGDVAEWYRTLAGLRHGQPVMSAGDVRFFSTDGSVLGILRHTSDGRDFFGRETPACAVLTVINPMDEPRRIVFELDEVNDLLKADEGAGPPAAVSLLTGMKVPLNEGLAEIDIPPITAEIFSILS